jgi:hypothetical protein
MMAGPFIVLALALLFYGLVWADETDLVWSTFLGKSDADEGFGIAVDGSGNVYVTGFVGSVDFPTTAGAFDTTYNGGCLDAFVAKFNPTGSALAYATFLGGDGPDQGYGIAVDGSGGTYVTGRTMSVDFPTTAGVFDTTHNGNYDIFLVKLNPQGSHLSYATYLGGSDYEQGKSIAVDGSGHAYLTGWTRSIDFPTTGGAFRTSHCNPAEEDAFVAKFDPAGRDLVYATFLGGSGEDWGRDIAVCDSGNAYVAGLTYSEDFSITAKAFDTTYNGNRDAFVVKLNPAGSALDYATFLGGGHQDWSQGIAVDGAGNAYLIGVTFSADFPTTAGAFDTTHNGLNDVFVAQINPIGNALTYATFLGGSDGERGTGIAVDHAGSIYLTGWTRSIDFPTVTGAFDTSHNGRSDVFVVKLNPTENFLAYATFLGGDSNDVAHGIAVDDSGFAYLTGWTESGDFPTTAGVFDTTYNGSEDAFVTKLDLRGYPRSGRTGRFHGHQ